MPSSLRRVAALLWAPAVAGVHVWGCATNDPRWEPAPALDPSLPAIDASWAPTPERPRPIAPDAAPDGEARSAEPGDAGGTSGKNENESATPAPYKDAPKPAQGEVLITEVMYNPSTPEPESEWFEVHNTTSKARSLSGLTIADGADRTHVIGPGVIVPPGGFVVLARSLAGATAASVPASVIAYEYGTGAANGSGIQLANGDTGAVFLRDGAVTIAQADYGGWFSANGSSIQLHVLGFAASAQSASWCLSSTPWAPGSDKGTPGAPSDCP
jgi:hypothetical protein